LLFQRSALATFEVRKCRAFVEYVQCIFEDHETYPCAAWLPANDFNYSDGLTHRLWGISDYVFIVLKEVVYLLSKDIVGNDVTSCIFLSWMIILIHASVRMFGQPWGFQLLYISLLMLLGQV
jgi:hypothetical protein